jgi:translation elongation factor EF-G
LTNENETNTSQLIAKPRLLELVYLVEIQAPQNELGGIYSVLN